MILRELSRDEIRFRLGTEGLNFRCGPFVVRVQSRFSSLANELTRLYGEHIVDESGFADFPVCIDKPKSLRRWFRPQALFYFNGSTPFKPLPATQAYPFFEWGLNWCIATHAHQFLILHAAVVALDDKALIMPGPPGAGKSTLCAGLVARGWRLLSDELTLVSMETGLIHPLARPINLKNESIQIMKSFAPGAVFSDESVDTQKGTVALMKPPIDSVRKSENPARAVAVMLPQYEQGEKPTFLSRSKARSCMDLAEQAFNFGVIGENAFHRITELVDSCECLTFYYGGLEAGVAAVSERIQSIS